MSARFPVKDAISGWCLAPDLPAAPAAWPQVIFAVTATDEITGLPPAAPLSATSGTAGFLASGLGGLAGIPITQFAPPTPQNPWNPHVPPNPRILDTTAIDLQLTLSGPGYLPLLVTTTIGPEPGYPQTFAAAATAAVALHRAPVSLVCQVTNNAQAALANAAISVDGIWLTLADLSGVAAAANLIALLAPIYAARDATASVAAVTLAAGAATKTLLAVANVGDRTLLLSDQLAIAAGSTLALDTQDPQRVEYVTLSTTSGAAPAQPAMAVLDFPLARPHAAGVVVTPMTTTATGAANNLAQAAQTGDVTMLPATMNGLVAGIGAVLISGGGNPVAELHPASLYTARSDSNGHAVLPPIHRLAQLILRVHQTSQPTDLLSTVILPFGATTLALSLAFS